MLIRVEAKIMDLLFERCRGKKSVLVTPKEILQAIMPKYELTAKQLDGVMKNLALDGYVEVHNSDRNGNAVYVVSLRSKGEAYEREKAERKRKLMRSILFKIGLTAIGLTMTGIFWWIFWPIFRG